MSIRVRLDRVRVAVHLLCRRRPTVGNQFVSLFRREEHGILSRCPGRGFARKYFTQHTSRRIGQPAGQFAANKGPMIFPGPASPGDIGAARPLDRIGDAAANLPRFAILSNENVTAKAEGIGRLANRHDPEVFGFVNYCYI